MRQGSSVSAARPWVVRWLLVAVLALCVLVMNTSLGSHHPSAAKAPTGYSANGFASTGLSSTAAAHPATASQSIKVTAETTYAVDAGQALHGQKGDNCSCCPAPLGIAARCAEVTTSSPQHGMPPQTPFAYPAAAPGLVPPGRAAQRAAPPSLAELSLLRI
jgi:hypothetical protein